MPLDFSFEPFKEPRGFLKVLQWLFAICAFATTVNFSTNVSFKVDETCPKDTNSTPSNMSTVLVHTIEYPFAVDNTVEKLQFCNGTDYEQQFYGHARSDSEFFVATGVLTFLYTTALIGVYLLVDRLYTENPRIPIIDFFVTLVFAVFWLSGSAAWAQGLSNIKTGADLETWLPKEILCTTSLINCSNFYSGAFGGIVISILFGFINFILWSANLWFLYKETSWFDGFKNNPNSNTGGITTGA